ncbi:hypothetical protein [Dechloromonas sp. HYN0024]|uniref:hypothetical protein n=1 Tax=Dechloromonas sp. HYN0024 TaxID=2231055 RepID=UPI000E44BB32|nr:hypothetical protein [Dechloromonas sp. HYN0024]AXS79868.1 hypothetical protein HYN24_07460 [Dechloromonas sp. HYN0024]
MKPIAEFLPTPDQVLAAGDVWDRTTKEARYILLTLGGQLGAIGPSIPWADIPATFRLELVHRVYLFRDLLNRVLP